MTHPDTTQLNNLLNEPGFVEPAESQSAISEAEYKSLWAGIIEPDPFFLGLRGGLLADRLAFVFIAGYQAAIRNCFPGVPDNKWIAFAVSEDRTGEYPGTVIDDDGNMSGHKSWVACANQLDVILVTAKCGDETELWQAGLPHQAVTITVKPPAGFLADMSVGRAYFNKLSRSSVTQINGKAASNFGLAEPFYVTSAACGFLLRQAQLRNDMQLIEAVRQLLTDLLALYHSGFANNQPVLAALYGRSKALGKQLAKEIETEHKHNFGWTSSDWATNGRLLGMYGRNLATTSPQE